MPRIPSPLAPLPLRGRREPSPLAPLPPGGRGERCVAQARQFDMDGFWIILVEIAVVLAIAAFIVWWTMKR
jgi:hypothetical protein